MADEGAETPTVLPKIDFHFVLQTAASDISTTQILIEFVLSLPYFNVADSFALTLSPVLRTEMSPYFFML